MTVEEAVDKILALRELTGTSGMITVRSQRTILQSLNDADLAEVSLRLAQSQSALSGKGGAK